MAIQTKEAILTDVDAITTWLEQRNEHIKNGRTIVHESEMPVLAKVICGGESYISISPSSDQRRYKSYFEKNKSRSAGLTLGPSALGANTTRTAISSVASGVGVASAFVSLGASGSGGMTLGIAASSGLGLVSMGAAAFLPVLWPIGISILAAGAGSLFSKAKKGNTVRAARLEKVFEASRINAQKCSEKIQANNKKIQLVISQKLKKAIDMLQSKTEAIKINIDDALHVDHNLRIMQYQEIVLKQYNSQNEIRKMFADLVEAYNALVVENQKLADQLAAYEANMRMCGCTSNYLG